ncbi:lipoate--protein ligase family protein [Bacillus sp. FJAT-44742]|uniref:lipoate--protein ligase family protein n=1 Tax=Bacillus sp. FJAT-44742 TaxID=2014005 RepID=UPI000C245EB1|nr:lipoate--protein ligase family protein [Bacillus sp. FJAT-44742]
MNILESAIRNQSWRWIDHSSSGLQFNALQSFAMDDTLCTSTGEGKSPSVLRAWVHSPTIVLGIQDSRLPSVQAGIHYLKDQGYDVIVRNSGGLAVVLDEGILNLSVIMTEKKKFTIDYGYDMMWKLIQEVFADSPGKIEAYEVEGSYCPGSYDLSINGQKFAGISQRRIRGGAAVQIYLCMTGSGGKRASLLKNFYDRAAAGGKPKFFWPKIKPEVMASLSELYGNEITVNEVLYRLLTFFQNNGAHLQTSQLTNEEIHLFDYQVQRVTERNKKALERNKDISNHL